MICKKCGEEMPEVGTFCPFCGEPKVLEGETADVATEEVVEESVEQTETEEIAEETTEEAAPAVKLKLWKLIAIIAAGVVVLAILIGAVLYGLGVGRDGDVSGKQTDTQLTEDEGGSADKTDPTQGDEAAEATGENDVSDEALNAANEEVAVKAKDVVATLGNKELTVAELQLYYSNEVYTFLNQYYSYIGAIGLDLSLPLEDQVCPIAEEEGTTWQQYFRDLALNSWQSYALLENMMEKDGYVPSKTMQEQLDSMDELILSAAQSYGYADAQSYLEEQIAPGVTLETYLAFNKAYYTGNEYLDQLYVKEQPTGEEIEAYYLENQQTFTDNGVAPGMGLHSAVRHILIQPEGGTTAEDGVTVTYSDEEQAAAYAEAERILEEWKAGDATEESFAELANTYSKDGGSNTTGGLYEGINKDASYVEEFRAWAADANRQVGDVAIVQTQFGYHIMYFVSGEDYFTYTVGQQLVAQRVQEILVAARETYPVEINYEAIVLYAPNF